MQNPFECSDNACVFTSFKVPACLGTGGCKCLKPWYAQQTRQGINWLKQRLAATEADLSDAARVLTLMGIERGECSDCSRRTVVVGHGCLTCVGASDVEFEPEDEGSY